MIKVKTFVFNLFNENTFVVRDQESGEGMIIDPGCCNQKEENELADYILSKEIKIKYIINTHCHIDHIFGNTFTKEKYKAEFLVPEDDVFLLDMMIDEAKNFGVGFVPSPEPDGFLTEDLELKIGDSKMKFIFTPGHSPGEFSVLFEESKICFTGDVLFRESIGRTDLWNGNQWDLFDSINNKLFKLDDDVKIYPGHGPVSTIGHEKLHNPFL